MTVSILIPTYNRSRYIKQCLDSVLNQTYANIRVCIYDDGSTDDTVEKIRSIRDSRITLHTSKINNGVVHARNWLLDMVDTDYAMWQDSDDVSNCSRVEVMLRQMQSRQAPIVYSEWDKFYTAAPNISEHPRHNASADICFASAIFNINIVPKFREIDRHPTPTTLGGEDVVWRNEIDKDYGTPYIYPYVLYYVRRHDARISVWRKNPNKNIDWHNRMSNRIK